MASFAGLESVLDQTAAALMTGNLNALAGLAAGAEALAATLATQGCDPEQARRLMQKAQRNERLIVAATNGVKAARRRAQELTDAGRFSTYDAGGRRDQPGLAAASPSRRF